MRLVRGKGCLGEDTLLWSPSAGLETSATWLGKHEVHLYIISLPPSGVHSVSWQFGCVFELHDRVLLLFILWRMKEALRNAAYIPQGSKFSSIGSNSFRLLPMLCWLLTKLNRLTNRTREGLKEPARDVFP